MGMDRWECHPHLPYREMQPPSRTSLVVQSINNLPANAGYTGLISASGRSPGEGNGYSLQYSCLENPMDRGAWRATVHRVAKNQTGLSDWATAAATTHRDGCVVMAQVETVSSSEKFLSIHHYSVFQCFVVNITTCLIGNELFHGRPLSLKWELSEGWC